MTPGAWLIGLTVAGCLSWEPTWAEQLDDSTRDSGSPDDDSGAVFSGDCDLVDDLATRWFWEGDTVGFRLACSGDLATENTLIQAEALPDGAAWDSSRLALSWTTGPTDGGRRELVFSSRPRGNPGQVPTVHTVTVWVADNPELADAVRPDPDSYREEWGLPVIHLDPVGLVTQEYTDATVHWQGQGLPARMKVRGATSSQFPKQSYTLDFTDEEPVFPGFGGDSRDHLVLVSTFDDNSYVRQKLIYDLWAAMARFWGQDRLTPRSFFVVVYQERYYQGLYVALDRIDDEFLRQMGLDDGGNLYKAIDHNANYYADDYLGEPKATLHDGYEKKEGEPEDDFADLDALVHFTATSSLPDLLSAADDWVVQDEFMDWFLLVHYALAEDSTDKNAYLYREPDSQRFRYVPWDFNHSWGQDYKTRRLPATDVSDYVDANKLFAAFQVDDEARTTLWARFAQLRNEGPMHPDRIRAMVDDYYAAIEPSARRDWAAWSAEYSTYETWAPARTLADDWTDFEAERAYLYQWLDDRALLYAASAR